MNEQDVAQKLMRLIYDFQQEHEPRGRKKTRMNIRDMMILRGISRLSPEGMIRMSQIKDHLRVSPAAVSQGIRAFEGRGWVERVILDEDRRSVYIRITEEGQQLMQECEADMNRNMIRYFRYLGEDDCLALIRILEKTITYCQNEKVVKSMENNEPGRSNL